jgi:pimeloyl-ACP methyl ester carboxylesterase
MSVRRLLQGLLLLQAGAAAGFAWAGWRHLGLHPLAALGAGLACVLLLRFVISLNNFLLSYWFASPTPQALRVGPRSALRLVAGEFGASMLQSSWCMVRAPLPAQIFPPTPGACAPPPVLLLHGYGCNSGYWRALARRLARQRISHASVDLTPLAGPIDAYAPAIEQALRALCAATGAPQAVIVAHSMGGLAARAWLRDYGSARLARLITLGTPHQGTCLARFGLGANAAQMRRTGELPSAWLRALGDSEDSAQRARMTSIFSHHDNIVAPQTASLLDGARHIALGGVGHVALGANARVLDIVLAELAELAAPAERAAPASHA